MRLFVDTSALFALINRQDKNHEAAQRVLGQIVNESALLFTTNYVLLESLTLIQNRLGMIAVTDFQKMVVPLCRVQWIDERFHQEGLAALLIANQRRLSLVDCTSFVVMRYLGLDTAFAFDHHFAEQGFQLLS